MGHKTEGERILDLEQELEVVKTHLAEVEELARNPVVKIIRKRKKSTKKKTNGKRTDNNNTSG